MMQKNVNTVTIDNKYIDMYRYKFHHFFVYALFFLMTNGCNKNDSNIPTQNKVLQAKLTNLLFESVIARYYDEVNARDGHFEIDESYFTKMNQLIDKKCYNHQYNILIKKSTNELISSKSRFKLKWPEVKAIYLSCPDNERLIIINREMN